MKRFRIKYTKKSLKEKTMLRYGGKSMEELGSIMKEKNITLSILAPRKIPALYNIFDKAGGDLLQVSHPERRTVDFLTDDSHCRDSGSACFWASRIRIH
jgi:hypothetical protein